MDSGDGSVWRSISHHGNSIAVTLGGCSSVALERLSVEQEVASISFGDANANKSRHPRHLENTAEYPSGLREEPAKFLCVSSNLTSASKLCSVT
jgi:hypothetical protein